jgi:hypothetical protein
LGHFVQADTLVPDASYAGDYHRYAYTRFNPLKYTDPTGHVAIPSQRRFDAHGGGGGGLLIGLAVALAVSSQANGDLPDISLPPLLPDNPPPLIESVPRQTLGTSSTSFPLADDGPETSIPAPSGVYNDTLIVTPGIEPVQSPAGNVYTSQSEHSVYTARNPVTGEMEVYVGRTSQGINTRERQHQRTPGREGWVLREVRSGLSLEQAKELEQELIIQYGLGNLENKRNEIAPNKWSERLRELYVQRQGD